MSWFGCSRVDDCCDREFWLLLYCWRREPRGWIKEEDVVSDETGDRDECSHSTVRTQCAVVASLLVSCVCDAYAVRSCNGMCSLRVDGWETDSCIIGHVGLQTVVVRFVNCWLVLWMWWRGECKLRLLNVHYNIVEISVSTSRCWQELWRSLAPM